MTPIERAAEAVAALHTVGDRPRWSDNPDEWTETVRVVLQAVRDPSATMADRAASLGVWSGEWLGSYEGRATEVWEAMIDAALEDVQGPSD